MKKIIPQQFIYGITTFLIALSINYTLHAEQLHYRRLISIKAQHGKGANKNAWDTLWCGSNNPWWRVEWQSLGDLRPLYFFDILIGAPNGDTRSSDGGELMMILKAGDPEFTGEVKSGDPIQLIVMTTRHGSWENTNLGFGARWYVHNSQHEWFGKRNHILITMSPWWQGSPAGDIFSLASTSKGFGEVLDTNDIININHTSGPLSVIQHGYYPGYATIVVGGNVTPSTSNNFSFTMLSAPNGANNNAFAGAEAFTESPNITQKLYTGSTIRIKRPNGKYVYTEGTVFNGNQTNAGNIGTQFRLYIHRSGLFGLESVANPGSFLMVDKAQVTSLHDSEYNWRKARRENTKIRMEGNVSLKKLTSNEIVGFKDTPDQQLLWFIKGTLSNAFIINAASNTFMRGEDGRISTGAGFSFHDPNDNNAGEIRFSIEIVQGVESASTIARIQATEAKAKSDAEAAQAKTKADAEAAQATAAKQTALSFANQFAKTENGQPRIFALAASGNRYLKIVSENNQPIVKTEPASLENLQDQGVMFTATVNEDGSVGLTSKLTNKLLQAEDLGENSSDGFTFANGSIAKSNASSWILTRPANSTSLEKVSFKNKGNSGYLSVDTTSNKVSTGFFASPIDYIKNGTQQPISSLSQFRVVDISPFTDQLTQGLNKPTLAENIQAMTTLMASAITNEEKKMYIKEIESLVNKRTADTLPALKALLNNLIYNTPAAFTQHDIIDTQTGHISSKTATQDYVNYAKEIMQFVDVAKTRTLSIVNKKGKVGILGDDSMQFIKPGTGVISCKAKAVDSFAFALSTEKTLSTINDATYVIYFGINNNTQTVVMKNGKPVQAYNTKEALLKTDGNFHTYWVAIENGSLSCGVDTPLGQTPSIVWKDTATLAQAVKFVGFSCNESPVEIQEITLYQSLPEIAPEEELKSININELKKLSVNEQIARLRGSIYDALEEPKRRRLFIQALEFIVGQGWKMTPEQKAEIKEFIKQVQFMREFTQDSAPFSSTEGITLYQKLAQLIGIVVKEYSYVEKTSLIRKILDENILTLPQDNPERIAFFNDKLDAFIKEKEPKTTDEINLIKDDILLFLKYGKDKELSASETSKVDALLNSINEKKGTPTVQAVQADVTFKQIIQDYRKKIDEVLTLPTTDSKRLAFIDTELGKFISTRKEKTAESRTVLTNEILMYTKYGKPGSLTDAENKVIDKHLASLTKEAEDLAKLAESLNFKVTQAKEKLESIVLLPSDNQDRIKFFDGELGKLIADRKTKTAEDRTLIKDNLLLYAKYGKAQQITEPEKLVIEKHLDTLKKEEALPVTSTIVQPAAVPVEKAALQPLQVAQQPGIYVPRTAPVRPGMTSSSGIRRQQLRRR